MPAQKIFIEETRWGTRQCTGKNISWRMSSGMLLVVLKDFKIKEGIARRDTVVRKEKIKSL